MAQTMVSLCFRSDRIHLGQHVPYFKVCFMLDRFLIGQRVPERGDHQRAVFLCVSGLTGFTRVCDSH